MAMVKDEIDRGVLSVRFFDLHLAELVAWSCSVPVRILKLRWPPGSTGAPTLALTFSMMRSSTGRIYTLRPDGDEAADILARYEAAIAANDAAYLAQRAG